MQNKSKGRQSSNETVILRKVIDGKEEKRIKRTRLVADQIVKQFPKIYSIVETPKQSRDEGTSGSQTLEIVTLINDSDNMDVLNSYAKDPRKSVSTAAKERIKVLKAATKVK